MKKATFILSMTISIIALLVVIYFPKSKTFTNHEKELARRVTEFNNLSYEIYTPTDIYFVTPGTKTLTSDSGLNITFETQEELATIIKELTIEDEIYSDSVVARGPFKEYLEEKTIDQRFNQKL